MLRKAFITGILMFFNKGSLVQVVVAMVFCLAFLCAVAWLRPFASRTANLFKVGAEAALLVSLMLIVLLKVDLSKEDVPGGEGFIGQLLLLSTRELRRFPIDKGKHLNHVQHCANFVFDFGRWHIAHFQRKSQIFTHRHMREQGVILKHHANATLMRRNIIDRAAA